MYISEKPCTTCKRICFEGAAAHCLILAPLRYGLKKNAKNTILRIRHIVKKKKKKKLQKQL